MFRDERERRGRERNHIDIDVWRTIKYHRRTLQILTMFNEMEVPKSLLLILAVVLVRALSNCRIGVDVSRAQIEQAVEKARSRINNNMMFWVGDGTKLRAFKYS